MRITIDRSASLAYVYLRDDVPRGGVNRSEPVGNSFIVLDWDANEKLIGIELSISSFPEEAIAQAEIIG